MRPVHLRICHLGPAQPRETGHIGGLVESSTLEKRAVNRNLRRLTEAGLIQIAESPSGHRGIVTLTRGGVAALKKAVPLWQVAQSRFEALNGSLLRETLNGLVLEG